MLSQKHVEPVGLNVGTYTVLQYLPLTLLPVLIQNGLSPFSRTTLNSVTPFGKVIRYATLATSLSTRFSTQMCACCPVKTFFRS